MIEPRPQRVLAVASGGGHWVQLMRLRPAFANDDVTFVTVHEDYRSDTGEDDFRVVTDATRWSPWRLFVLACQMLWIVLRVRPDVVITTGAAPGFFAVRFARLAGARTAWIDSIANAEHLSLSGARIGPRADLWLTQWPALARPEGPHFRGAVL